MDGRLGMCSPELSSVYGHGAALPFLEGDVEFRTAGGDSQCYGRELHLLCIPNVECPDGFQC